ncbi:MAG: RNA polymerase sigma factor [Desulfobacula sp.]|nr:RNA polymerase sigma factor [Desulfobacula sp.]
MNYRLFKKQIESLVPDVKRFSLSLTRNKDDCDDLAQQSLTTALSKAHRFKENSNLKSWVFRIVYTTWIDINRKKKTITNYRNMVQENYLPHNTGGNDILSINTFLDYKKMLGLLPEKQKASFHLVCIEGYSYGEASKILGVPVGTVASRVSHSRDKLNQLFLNRKKLNINLKGA